MIPDLHAIAGQFAGGQPIIEVSPLGNGLINATFRVETAAASFVLQRINGHVFPKPELVMFNLERLGQHIASKHASLEIPATLPAADGQSFFRDQEGEFWRALQLIHPAESRERLSNQDEAAQVGFALAHFHRLCSDLPTTLLHDTLPGFHITPDYFRDYQILISQPLIVADSEQVRYCREFIEAFRDKLTILEHAKHQGLLNERVIHGDPKLNNFLFQPGSDHIVSLIDLDTVKPGLVHYDIGDCLRSCCHVADGNRFDINCCSTILTSYLQEAGQFFSQADFDHLYAAIELIPFELGLRFFSDYLAGNKYFKVNDPEHNLRRAEAQFRLCEDIARQRIEIEGLVSDLRPA